VRKPKIEFLKKQRKEINVYFRSLAIGVAAATLVTGSTVAFAASSSAKKPIGKMTCGDFLAIEDHFQPKVVYYAVAYAKGGKVESAGVDVAGIENIVPAVVNGCKNAPKESFWEKVKAEVKKLENKM
jgi:acid stress chaperone HdeA